MSEDKKQMRDQRNNKLLLETFTTTLTKMIDEKFEALRRDRVKSDQNRDRARQRKEQDLKPKPPDERLRSTQSGSHKISHTPKSKAVIYPDYQQSNELYKFSGKRDYLEWEENMDEWFHCNHILREDRLSYAVSQLTREAYNWWVREVDDRWYYKEPTITSWRELKKLLRKKYAPQRLSRTAQTNATVQRLGVQEKKPALVSDQKEYEELDKRVLEALKADVKSQKKKSSTTQSDGSKTAKEVTKQLFIHKQSLKPSLESSGEPKQCESSNLSKSRGVTCFHCRKKGHFIATCPEKLQLTITPIEPKLSSLNSNSEVVDQGLENSSSCVMHLFLSKGVDSGHTMEHESDKPVEQLAYLTNSLEAKCILSSIQS